MTRFQGTDTKSSPDFYQAHYRAYHDRTFPVDATPFLNPFQKRLPRGATVLDVGCGSGRDLLWLNQRGFAVVGLERSPGLADLARKHVGCKVIQADFENFDFSSLAVDAVMMSGSLVHVPHVRLPVVLARILRACHPGQGSDQALAGSSPKMPKHVYISLKEGRTTKKFADGRIFYLWKRQTVLSMLEQQGLTVLEVLQTVSPLRAEDVWLAFIASIP
ncbi:MAG: class I SAM-dependent methyltransferase [Deltaproteobacteria bacterium]|nr:class I SAM-dependent methyltransferase [Deltaproteobacteria bacterium]